MVAPRTRAERPADIVPAARPARTARRRAAVDGADGSPPKRTRTKSNGADLNGAATAAAAKPAATKPAPTKPAATKPAPSKPKPRALPSRRRASGPASRRWATSSSPRSSSTTTTPTLRPSGARSSSPSRPTATSVARRASRTSRTRSPSAQILADLGIDPVAVQAALLHDVPEDTEYALVRHRGALRQRGRAARRRRDQARQVLDAEPRAAAGREHPEDVPGDGRRHPRRAHQARRPAAQHAHPRRAPAGEAAPDRAPDPRDLRPARRAPRDLADQVGARGPRLQGRSSRSGSASWRSCSTPAARAASRSSSGRSRSSSRA